MRRTTFAISLVIATMFTIWGAYDAPHATKKKPPPHSATQIVAQTTANTPTTTVAAPPTTTTPPPRPVAPRAAPTTIPVGCPAPIVDAVHRHFDRFGIEVANWFVGIVWRESNCRPDVISPGRCYGLAQMALPLHAGIFAADGHDWRTTWMDPDANLMAAARLYAGSGPRPWQF